MINKVGKKYLLLYSHDAIYGFLFDIENFLIQNVLKRNWNH